MSQRDDENLYSKLKRVFHEPNRLAIVTALVGKEEGMTFTGIKKECDLTDGNLSRHLTALEEDGVINIEKTFVGVKPRTTVSVSMAGRESFVEYLDALANALVRASEALEANH